MASSPAAPIEVLEILQTAKKRFHDGLSQLAIENGAESVSELREDNVFVLVEYMFMFASLEVGRDGNSLESYIGGHNRYIAELLEDRAAQRTLGLSPQRIERGYFTAEQIQKARANLLLPTPGVDQADLQRLTVLLFSPETTRQTIEVLEKAGFLERITTPFRSKIIHSFGVAERLFGAYLDEIAGGLSGKKR
ncbi:MAG TPA: hypothetical protein PK286_01560 [Devosia sp.]|nr:hypothetical protein [Devosia sp.]